MIANKINPETGNPICVCGEDCLPAPAENALVSGSKGLVILHKVCIEMHNARVLAGEQ